MEFYRIVVIYCALLIQISLEVEANTKIIDLNSRPSSQYNYLPPIATNNNKSDNNFFQQTKSYTTKPQRSTDNFDAQPELRIHKFSAVPSDSGLFTSYAPPPSGLVPHKNIQLPLVNSEKLPLLLPKSTKANDCTKYPDSVVDTSSTEDHELKDPDRILMVEEPAAVVLQPQFHKTIEAANILASTILEERDKLTSKLASPGSDINKKEKSMEILLLKPQEQPFIIPKHLKQEVTKPSAVDQLSPMNDRLQKAYTINQFIFVIKPEKISFLNRLV